MPLKDTRGLRKGVSPFQILDDAERSSGLSIPSFRLPESVAPALSSVVSGQDRSNVAPEPNINDVFKGVFEDVNNIFAPTPEEVMLIVTGKHFRVA